MTHKLLQPCGVLALALSLCSQGVWGQAADPNAKGSPVERAFVGDAPDDPGPLATNISSQITHVDVRNAMTRVADWQLRTAQPHFNQQWTFAALYDGFLAASKATGNAAYRDAVMQYAEAKHWQLITDRFPHADDMAIGQAYLDLYLAEPASSRNPKQIEAIKSIVDRLVVRPDDPAKDVWWWCDALFMAPPVLSRMYVATGDRKYLAYMDKEWSVTTDHLYDRNEDLYFRDSRYFTQKETNGKSIFWSRGNGWVVGALVKVLEVLPRDDPKRSQYIAQLKEMCTKLASIQGADGLWRSGLLNPAGYDKPEISGSSFFVYAMAYGIHQGWLDKKTFLPVVQKGWTGLTSHIYEDGRLGSIQPIDAQPGKFSASASSVFGVGGFLLAGSEVDRLAKH